MAQLGRGQPVPAVISRGSLADAPVLTTPAPLVAEAAATPGYGQPQPPLIFAAPLITLPVAAVTPAPVVVTPRLAPVPAATLAVTRGALQDPADFTGRQP